MAANKRFNFTKAAIEALPSAAPGERDTYHDTRQPALSIRATETGKKSFRVRGRPRGRLAVETLTIGPFPAVTIEQARAATAEQLARWARSESIVAKKAEVEQSRRSAITFDAALRDYVDSKRRGKDGKALKQRTRDDYLRMVQLPDSGSRRAAGSLAPLASRSLDRISADDIRSVYAGLLPRGERQAAYAMAVLRAVLNWHGVRIPGNPLDKATAGRDRIRIAQASGQPNPIPVERLGAWWRAACPPPTEGGMADVASDYLRFLLLTGARSIEIKGSKRGKTVFGPGVLVGDIDLVARRVLLRDTKNRSDHTILLSHQALEIARHHTKDKTPKAPLFAVGDVRSRLQAINAAAGVSVSPHDLRATFASLAEELVSVYALKRMLNHAAAGDVTAGHYVAKSEAQLRAGWQAVADFIEGLAEQCIQRGRAADAQHA